MNAFSARQKRPDWGMSHAPAWVGELDRVDADGVIEGWCWCPERPDTRATVVIKLDGIPVASARCDAMRPDLAASGMGDGAYGFLVIVVQDFAEYRPDAWISLHDCETGRLLGTPRNLGWRDTKAEANPPAAGPPLIEGNLDGVSSEGVVGGWCWHPLQPGVPISVTVAIDGQVVGTTRATQMRPDLAKAGIGDGAHGFSFALPASMLATTGQLHVSVADAATGQGFGVPCVARLGQLAATQDRLADLEHLMRRLGADLAALIAEDMLHRSRSPSIDLFATLGTLFQDMARQHTPQAVQNLPSDGPAARAAEGDLALAVPTHPKAIVVVPVGEDIDELHACLRHLHAQATDQHAEIILFDGGAASDPGILHATIRNLRIATDPDADLQAWLTSLSRPGVPTVFLAPVLRPEPSWLDSLLSAHHENPNAAVIAGLVMGQQDGLLRSAGIDAAAHDVAHESGQLERADNPLYRRLRKVEAVSALGFLLSPDAMSTLKEVAHRARPTGLAEAALDLCLRLRACGRDILIQPAAIARCADGADLGQHIAEAGRCDAALDAAWQTRPRLAPPAGQILLIGDQLPAAADAHLALSLHQAGCVVTCAATSATTPAGRGAWLEQHGIAVAGAQELGSISALLLGQANLFDIIAFTSAQPSPTLVERTRLLAPQARLVELSRLGRLAAPSDLSALEAIFWRCVS